MMVAPSKSNVAPFRIISVFKSSTILPRFSVTDRYRFGLPRQSCIWTYEQVINMSMRNISKHKDIIKRNRILFKSFGQDLSKPVNVLSGLLSFKLAQMSSRTFVVAVAVSAMMGTCKSQLHNHEQVYLDMSILHCVFVPQIWWCAHCCLRSTYHKFDDPYTAPSFTLVIQTTQ